jgi:hypothetical protein
MATAQQIRGLISGTTMVTVDQPDHTALRDRGGGEAGEPEEPLATLAALRARQSRTILDEICTWLMTQRALPRSALGRAIASTGGP